MQLPAGFREYFLNYFDERHLKAFEDLPEQLPTVIRFNRLKDGRTAAEEGLRQAGFQLQPLPFYEDAFVVRDEPTPVSKTLEHFLGYFYIQSPASMLPPLLLELDSASKVLDIAAAPGSKTTQMAQLMYNRGILVANEWDDKRIKTLSHNLERIGVVNAALVNMPGERIGNLLPETFDRALVDAPCSALGVIHKAPQAVENLTKIHPYAMVQERLFISAVKALQPGGILVYSTCTIAPEENEKLIDRMLKQYPLELMEIQVPEGLDYIPGLTKFGTEILSSELTKTIRLIPNAINPEAFFIAKMRKTDSIPVREPLTKANPVQRHYRLDSPDAPVLKAMFAYFERRFGIPETIWKEYRYQEKIDEILLTSSAWEGEEAILNRLDTHRVGIRAARMRRPGEWKLSTNLAQLLASSVTASRVALSDTASVKTFIDGGTLYGDFAVSDGGVIVWGMNYPLGCGVVHQGKLKSQMPKSRKVIGIDYPF